MKKYEVTLFSAVTEFTFVVVVEADDDFKAVDVAFYELFKQHKGMSDNYEIKQLIRLS